MNLLSLPEIAAMLILMGVLAWLRKQHRDRRVGLWMLGLSFVLLEAIASAFYSGVSPLSIAAQVVMLDAYLFAAITFGWAARQELLETNAPLPLFLIAATPLFLQFTAYALGFGSRQLFVDLSGASLLLGLVYLLWLFRGTARLRGTLLVLHLAIWGPIVFMAVHGFVEWLVYWGLAWLYLMVALSFRGSVQRNCIGGLVITCGFLLWATCFFVHPLVPNGSMYAALVDQVLKIQKFLVIIGMLLVLLEDETQRRKDEALRDPLTGLPNRRLFDDRLAQALERSRRSGLSVALFMVDLNGFKKINDTHGHPVGDQILQLAAARLQTVVRSSDTLARYGGDEFSVIINDLVRAEDCEQIAEALRWAVASVTSPQLARITLSGSVGCAVFPSEALDPTPLCALADARMYAEKRAGVRLLQRA